jgi:zinc and cadmium transporter
VLLHGGFSKKKALLLNFLTALTALVGVVVAFVLNQYVEGISAVLMPLAAGMFIYIAGSDLIPEMHKQTEMKHSLIQIFLFLCGIGVMIGLMLME